MANEMSGAHGAVRIALPIGDPTPDILSTVGKWSASQSFNPTAFAASNTKGAMSQRKGIVDWTGSFEQFNGYPSVMPGWLFTFQGYAGPISGVPGTVGPTLIGDAICDNISVAWDWTGNALIRTTVNMACVSPLRNQPGGAAVVDTSTVNGTPTAGTHIDILNITTAGGGYQPLCAEKATLNVLGNPINFSNSCSIGKGTETPPIPIGLAYQSRKPGIIGWNMSITLDNADASYAPLPGGNGLPFSPGDYVEIRAYIDGSAYWILRYGFVAGYSNYNVDIETGAIITYDVDIQGSADAGVGTDADGFIKLPGASVPYWPASGALLMTKEMLGVAPPQKEQEQPQTAA